MICGFFARNNKHCLSDDETYCIVCHIPVDNSTNSIDNAISKAHSEGVNKETHHENQVHSN